jgi:protein-L-isoaspartate(D-aspartate) O-methyltransferase
MDQLKDGGRIIIPVGPAWNQDLVLLHKRSGKLEQRAVLPVSFVPMTGEAGGSPKAETRNPKEGRSPKSE